MATTQDYINQLKIDKQNLVSMLNNMGVEASGNETFTSLTPKVGKIVTDPILQDKSITITENGTTNIVADEGYNGLNNVEVITNVASTGSTMNLFVQEEEPEKKDGIWIQKESEEINNVAIENIDLTEKWTNDIGSVRTPIAYGRAIKYKNYIYIFGGKNSSGTALNTACKYDLNTNTYTNIADMPTVMMSYMIGIVGTNIYLFGGSNGSVNQSHAYKYDILTDTYTRIKDLPAVRVLSGFASVGTDIYLIGGANASNVKYKSCYKYDTLTDEYIQIADLPVATTNWSCCTDGKNYIYSLGGFTDSGYTNKCYKYDISKNTWTSIASMPQTMGHNASGFINGCAYMFAGYNGQGRQYVYKYDPSTNKFSTLSNMSKVLFNAACAYGDNKAYLISGQTTNSYVSTISVYGLNSAKPLEEDSIVVSLNKDTYNTKILDNMAVSFDNVYFYKSNVYSKPTSYYGDGTKWTKI
jgi:N-acetylneuraminic acid mutarotase